MGEMFVPGGKLAPGFKVHAQYHCSQPGAKFAKEGKIRLWGHNWSLGAQFALEDIIHPVGKFHP